MDGVFQKYGPANAREKGLSKKPWMSFPGKQAVSHPRKLKFRMK